MPRFSKHETFDQTQNLDTPDVKRIWTNLMLKEFEVVMWTEGGGPAHGATRFLNMA
jgi:hypothetical protein